MIFKYLIKLFINTIQQITLIFSHLIFEHCEAMVCLGAVLAALRDESHLHLSLTNAGVDPQFSVLRQKSYPETCSRSTSKACPATCILLSAACRPVAIYRPSSCQNPNAPHHSHLDCCYVASTILCFSRDSLLRELRPPLPKPSSLTLLDGFRRRIKDISFQYVKMKVSVKDLYLPSHLVLSLVQFYTSQEIS